MESLKVAQTKVEVATSARAFGNGVPELYNIAIQDLMLAFTITTIGAEDLHSCQNAPSPL